ncbi:MAG: restriction endonuclease [Thermoplasmata archaeon]|nr:MAG: restriction endonuclease [Thermoplasmata archaeon]
MRSIGELVEELLRFNGFSIRREERFLAASKGSIRIVVRIESDAETLTGTYIEELRKSAGEDGFDRILLVHTGNVAPEARALLERYNVVLWDRERLSLELGRALLVAAEGDVRGPELAFMDYLLVDKRTEVTEEETPVPPTVTVTRPVEASFVREKAIAAGGQADIMTFADVEERVVVRGTKDRFVRVQLDPEAAVAKAPRLRAAERCDLQYIPYHMFDYGVELEDEVGDVVVRDNGTLAVNALTGQAQEWNLTHTYAPDAPTDPDADVLGPTIDAMAAYEQANRAVKDLHTRVVERVEERGTVTVFVKRHVKPRDGAIDIVPRGLVYMPVWCIEGESGVAVVNASTGRIVKEEYLD